MCCTASDGTNQSYYSQNNKFKLIHLYNLTLNILQRQQMFHRALLLSIPSVLHNFSSNVERSTVSCFCESTANPTISSACWSRTVYHLHTLVRISPSKAFWHMVNINGLLIHYKLQDSECICQTRDGTHPTCSPCSDRALNHKISLLYYNYLLEIEVET